MKDQRAKIHVREQRSGKIQDYSLNLERKEDKTMARVGGGGGWGGGVGGGGGGVGRGLGVLCCGGWTRVL